MIGPEVPDDPSDEDCDVDKMMEFLELGYCHIERSEQKQIFMVLGLTGAGKSTLVNFVTRRPNRLKAVKVGFTYKIEDEDGATGNSSISKTFVPGLAIHTPTNSALYDMPGFQDNRMECIEIANTFFTKEVADHGESIKIIVVAPDSTFSGTDKTSFWNLMKSLSKLISNSNKLSPGLGLVVTNMPHHAETDEVFIGETYADLLSGYLADLNKTDISPEDQVVVFGILDGLITNPSKISFFRTPTVEGFLDEMEVFQRNKQLLSSLFFDHLTYVPKNADDFKYGFSTESIVLIGNAVRMLLADVENYINSFIGAVKIRLSAHFTSLASGNHPNIQLVENLITGLLSVVYPLCNNKNSSPEEYGNEIMSNIKVFGESAANETSSQLSSIFSYLQFFGIAGDVVETQIRPDLWAQLLEDLPNQLKAEVISTGSGARILNNVVVSLQAVLSDIAMKIKAELAAVTDVYEMETKLNTFLNAIGPIKAKLQTSLTTSSHLKVFVNEYISSLTIENISPNVNLTQELRNRETAASVFLLIDEFGWKDLGWISSFDIVESSVQKDVTWNRFLRLLYEDLSHFDVQSLQPSHAKTWWKTTRTIRISEFPGFWANFTTFGINTVIHNDMTTIQAQVQEDPSKLDQLNSLMILTLGDEFRCPDPTAAQTIGYQGTFISIRDIITCQTANQGKSKIHITALHTVFIDAELNATAFGGAVVPDLLIVSPNMHIRDTKQLVFSGTNGAAPPSKVPGQGYSPGARGSSGGHAGNFMEVVGSRTGGSLVVALNGGSGGKGQDGQDGLDGSKGDYQEVRQYDNDYCSAWAGGWTKVWITPNKCFEEMDDSGRCKADDSGARWEVYGLPGRPGNSGNNGGDGGAGGRPGSSLRVNVDTESNSTTSGTTGATGPGGLAGAPGRGGQTGDTNILQIDDATGTSGKRCKILQQQYVPVSTRANDGSHGRNGSSLPLQGGFDLLTFNFNDFRETILAYTDTAADKFGDKFMGKRLTTFVNNVKNQFSI